MEGKSQKIKPLLGKRKGPANGKGDRSAPKLNKKGKASNGEGYTRKPRNGQNADANGKNKKDNEQQGDERKKKVYRADEDEIDSDEIDSGSEGDANEAEELRHVDDESEERKRVRLAQQILKNMKNQIEENGDESFDDGEDKKDDEKDNFKGVIHAENKHANAVTKALQNEILKKRQLIYTLFAEKVAKQWAKNTPEELQAKQTVLKGHTRCITSLEFTPDGKYLYSVSKDASIIRWDIFNADPKLKKVFLTRERTPDAHKDEILGMSINHLSNYLVTCSKDKTIKLWDIKKMQLVQTFAGHKSAVQGIKFGINSNTFCSVSADRTFKMWDATEKAFIDTFFGHKSESTSIDAVNGDTFVSSGFDRQVILWKTGHQSQLIYSGHDYSIDVVKAVDADHFLTGSQDGSIALWSAKKKKPIFTLKNAHSGCWITTIGHLFNTDLFFSGSSDGFIHAYQINLQQHNFSKIFSIPANGVINDIQLSLDCSILAYSSCDEHRLGRWVVDTKAKNTINCVKLL